MGMQLKPSLRWWQVAQQRGLLRDSSDDFNPSRIGSPYCGVSLSYLEALVASVKLVCDESQLPNGTTRDAMQQIIMPALLKSGNGSR